MISGSHKLSRLLITGPIDYNTPICVLKEIADAHGIKYNNLYCNDPDFVNHIIDFINKTTVPKINADNKDITHWQYMARFVNKDCNWVQTKLLQAYNFLLKFINDEDPLKIIPNNFILGLQTPEQPYNINTCILYKTCIYHKLNVNSQTSISQMCYAVRMLKENIESVLRRAIFFVEKKADRVALINTLMLANYEVDDPEYTSKETIVNTNTIPNNVVSYESLSDIIISLSDISTLRKNIEPSTTFGSVALAAVNFNIDISKSCNPIKEYKFLKLSGKNNYEPIDPWIKYWYQINPKIFDLSLSFNPLFPQGFYENYTLHSMAIKEGFTEGEIINTSPYELLQLAYVSDTFYLGKMPTMKAGPTSIDLDEIESIPEGELLCFGQISNPLTPITISELISLFDANENFTNPFTPDTVFTQVAINKLKIMLKNNNPNSPLSTETLTLRFNLLKTINRLEELIHNSDEPTRLFVAFYNNADQDVKDDIFKVMTHLLNMGMFMRGWLGKGPYPISSAVIPADKYDTVSLNVTDSIISYENMCQQLSKITTLINNLPLVIYKDGVYQASNEKINGLTIGERIQIVKTGEESKTVTSCIRLSSNWICSSVHKYMLAIGLDAPFNIVQLRHIA